MKRKKGFRKALKNCNTCSDIHEQMDPLYLLFLSFIIITVVQHLMMSMSFVFFSFCSVVVFVFISKKKNLGVDFFVLI